MQSALGVTPMVIPPGSPLLPPPPESPAPGLVIGTAGLIGGTGGTLNPVTGALLNPADPNYEAGALTLSKDNVTAAYGGGITLTVLGLPVTVPISVQNTLTAADGSLFGTGANQHLTLLGGVHSQNYITNINNGATTGGVLDPSAPAWADSCLNVNIAGLLGVNVPCWGVNAAQNNQVLIGDGATANGSEEVVIGTGASHVLAPVDANTLFPGDGNRNSTTDPMGVPDANYQSRAGHSVVIGDSASGTQNWQTIIGANATSNQPNSVALGYGSDASRGPQSGYSAFGLTAPQDSAGEVAVGNTGNNRQITHVAAGSDATDAVNVAQLEGAMAGANATDQLAVKYDADASGAPTNTVTLTGDGTGAPVGIANLAPGTLSATSTDAVNGSQLYATNTTLAKYFGGTTAYDGATNTWTAPDFTITNIDTAGNSTAGSYNNVTDAFSALDTSLTNVNSSVTSNTADLRYFQANSAGSDAAPTGTESVAIGGNATASANDSVAVGSNATANQINSVALGNGSVTTVGPLANYQAFGLTAVQTSAGELNIGNRQITGVAAGSVATDAVNVAQLQGAMAGANATDKLAVKYDADGNGDPTNTVTLAGDGTGAAVGITNLAPGVLGATSTDAVNGSQLYATNTTLAQYFGGTTAYDGGTNTWTAPDFTITNIDAAGGITAGSYNNVTDAFSALDTSLTNVNNRIINNTSELKYFHANSTGAAADAGGAGSVAMGGDSVAAGAGSVAAGSGAKAKTDGAVAVGSSADASGAGAVALGNGGTAVGDGAITIGNAAGAAGLGAMAFGNAAGATADGAVAMGNGASATVDGAVALGTGSVASRVGGGVEAFTGLAVPQLGVISVGAPGQTRQITNVAGGSADTDAVNVGQLKAVAGQVNGLSDLAVKYDADTSGNPTNTVTLLGGGSGAPVLITHLAAGAESGTSTDAINGSQLYHWTQDLTNIYSNVNLYKDIQNIYNGGAFVVNDTNGLGGATASGNNSAAGGAGTIAQGTDSTAVGNGAEATGANSVALGAGSVASRDDVVSVGSQGHERQITNVAAGTAQTDAVNVAQLDASQAGTVRYDTHTDGTVDYSNVTLGGPGGDAGPTVIHNVGAGVAGTDAVNVTQLEGVQNWAQQYTDLRVDGLQGQITNLGHRAFAGIASAMAMAGLPQAYLPGKSMASVAASSFHGESSLAVGVSVISNNGRWVYKLSGTGDSRGDAGVTVGAGIQW